MKLFLCLLFTCIALFAFSKGALGLAIFFAIIAVLSIFARKRERKSSAASGGFFAGGDGGGSDSCGGGDGGGC
ncbi:hypothetical protein [Thalassotalea fusca]